MANPNLAYYCTLAMSLDLAVTIATERNGTHTGRITNIIGDAIQGCIIVTLDSGEQVRLDEVTSFTRAAAEPAVAA